MLCQRCRGLLICEHLGELRAELGRICLATRCVNCGCIEDYVVRANRLRHPGKTVGFSRYGHHWRSRVLRARFKRLADYQGGGSVERAPVDKK